MKEMQQELQETTVFDGQIIKVTQRPVGDISEFETVHHPGAVAIVAHNDDYVYLTKEFRPAVGSAVIEFPAGTRDVAGEDSLQTAKRELEEECGLTARDWNHLCGFYSSPGYTDELVIMWHAWNLERMGKPEEGIKLIEWPLDDIAGAIPLATTAKTLVGLLMLDRLIRGEV